MKNKEKYAAEMTQIAKNGKIAILEGKPVKCLATKCSKCERLVENIYDICSDLKFLEWAESEYVEQQVDWSKVPVDTKILVSDDSKHWHRRHFAKHENGTVYAFSDGSSSWSAKDFGDECKEWNYAKLAEE